MGHMGEHTLENISFFWLTAVIHNKEEFFHSQRPCAGCYVPICPSETLTWASVASFADLQLHQFSPSRFPEKWQIITSKNLLFLERRCLRTLEQPNLVRWHLFFYLWVWWNTADGNRAVNPVCRAETEQSRENVSFLLNWTREKWCQMHL